MYRAKWSNTTNNNSNLLLTSVSIPSCPLLDITLWTWLLSLTWSGSTSDLWTLSGSSTSALLMNMSSIRRTWKGTTSSVEMMKVNEWFAHTRRIYEELFWTYKKDLGKLRTQKVIQDVKFNNFHFQAYMTDKGLTLTILNLPVLIAFYTHPRGLGVLFKITKAWGLW